MLLEVSKCHYLIRNNKPVIICVCRDKNGNRHIINVVGFEPFCFAPKGTVLPNENGVVRVESDNPNAKSWVYGSDEIFDKVVTKLPKNVAEIREKLERSGLECHQSKIVFPNVFKIQNDIYRMIEVDVPEDFDFKNKYIHVSKVRGVDKPLFWNTRKLYWDIEVDVTKLRGVSFDNIKYDGREILEYQCDVCGEIHKHETDAYSCVVSHEGTNESNFSGKKLGEVEEPKELKKHIKKIVKQVVDAPIICYSFYAEWEDRVYVFQVSKLLHKPKESYKTTEKKFYLGGLTKRELSDTREVIYNIYSDERDCHKEVVKLLTRLDFDIFVGFNNIRFDNPKIISRWEFLNIPYKNISPLGVINRDVIYGIEIMDVREMMMDLRRKGVKKNSLDWFANEYLKLSKLNLYDLVSDDLKSNHRLGSDIHGLIYHHGTKKDNHLLANYCLEDTMLTYLLDEKKRLTTTRIIDENIVGVEYKESLETVQPSYVYSLRTVKSEGIVLPNIISMEKRDTLDPFEGAHVFDPYFGVLNNVICLDFSQHYSTMMRIFNLGIDTILSEEIEGCIELPNGVMFANKNQRVSYVSKIFERFTSLRLEKQKKMKTLDPNSEEFKLLGLEEYRIKQKINEFYGFYKWVDNTIASCVPMMAKYFTLMSGEYVENKTKLKLVTGDTDSVYVWAGDLSLEQTIEIGRKMEKLLNLVIRTHIKEKWNIDSSDVKLKFERVCDFAQYGAKKNYTLFTKWHKDWKEGSIPSDEDRFVFKGFKNVRSDNSDLIEDIVTKVWKMIIEKQPIEDVVSHIRKIYKDVSNSKVDYDYLSKPTKFNKPLDDYQGGSINSVGVRSANNSLKLGIPIQTGDKPKMLVLDKIYDNPYGIQEHDRLGLNGVCYFEYDEVKEFVEKYTNGIDVDYYVNDLKNATESILTMFNKNWSDVLLEGQVVTGR